MITEPGYVVVIPTLGRASLQACVASLAAAVTAAGYAPRQVVLADGRRDTPEPLPVTLSPALADRALVVTSRCARTGRGNWPATWLEPGRARAGCRGW